jgi:holo-[acyl-carrier protein] synthase
MIVGVGVDLEGVSRMAKALEKHEGRLEQRLFTDRERAYCRDKANSAQHFAARFAAKEALLKALRVPEGLSWHELEVVVDDDGAPRFELTGVAAQAAAKLGVKRLHVSLSHAQDQAIALVVAEG